MSSNEVKSFEVSKWFSSVLDRVKNVENRQIYLNTWRNLAKKLKQTKRTETMKYVKRKHLQQKYIYNSRSRWQSFVSQMIHRRKKQLFTMAQKQLSEVRQHVNDIQRAKQSVNYPNSSSECYNSKSESAVFSEDDSQEISPYQKRWISMARRFLNQTKYQNLQNAFENFQDQNIKKSIERKELWKDMAYLIALNNQKMQLKKRSRQLSKAKNDWHFFYSNIMLTQKLNQIKAQYQKWKSLPFQNDDQVHAIWYRFYLSLKFKHNIIRIIRQSNAISTLTNFFRYILQINRSKAVANYFPIRYISTIRSIVKQSTIESAEKVQKFVSQSSQQNSIAFANNWSECIAEAYAAIATHQIGPAIQLNKQKKVSSISNKNSIFSQLYLPKKAQNQEESQSENEAVVDYPVNIIKITRDFDPNEELENEIQDIPANEIKENNIEENDYNIDSKERCIVAEVTDQKPSLKVNDMKDLSIDICPSNSQSSISIMNDDDDKPTQDIQLPKNTEKIKLSIAPPIYQESKDAKKKKTSKKKDFFAPVVIPENPRYFSPIVKKKHKKSNKEKEPNINEILNMVGISSSLELLDEDSEMKSTDGDSSEINFRFDDEVSDPLDSQNDLVIDLMKLQTSSSEDRRIKQSLLEVSEAQFSLPNEEEEQKQEIQPDINKKIDLLSLSNSPVENNDNIAPPNLSESVSSYNKSGSDKDATKNADNLDHSSDSLNGVASPRENLIDQRAINESQNHQDQNLQLSKEDDSNCKFNFEPEKSEQLYKPLSPIKNHPNDEEMVEVNDSYISDKDVDAAMHEYSSEEKK